MRLSVQYVNDAEGNVHSVQVPVAEWKKLLKALRGREQEQKIKSDIIAALKEIEEMRKSKTRQQTLQEFLSEL
jgi:ferritin